MTKKEKECLCIAQQIGMLLSSEKDKPNMV